ncbi:hypothetical protein R9X47_09400 [Wukongibacter baidiensis]|uniref:hypothetical protein n=1 Tax=Wukongibacter baidiensis TaxID=1723361 RepID=UPI003D7F9DCC
MRGVVSVVIITTLIFLLSGCSGNPQVKENNNPMESIKDNTSQGTSMDNQISDKNEDKDTEHNEYIEKNDDEETENDNPEVIAKSNNDVTSKEKEEILNEIDQMLDDVFDNINLMDELEDEDLTIED